MKMMPIMIFLSLDGPLVIIKVGELRGSQNGDGPGNGGGTLIDAGQ